MARTAIPVAVGSDAGGSAALTAANADGIIVPPNTVLLIFNSSGGVLTVTAQTPAGKGVPTGLNLSDRTLAIANAAWGEIGPFPPSFYARDVAPDIGQVYIDLSTVTGVSVLAVTVPDRLPA